MADMSWLLASNLDDANREGEAVIVVADVVSSRISNSFPRTIGIHSITHRSISSHHPNSSIINLP